MATNSRLFTVEFCRTARLRVGFFAVSFFGVVFGGVITVAGTAGWTFFGRPRVRFSLSIDFDRLRRDVVFVLENPSSSLESLTGGFSTGGRRLRRPVAGFFAQFSNLSSVSGISW